MVARVASWPVTNWADVLTGTLAGAVAQLDPERPPEGLGRLVLMFVLALAVTAPFAVRTVRKVRAGTWGRRGGAVDDATTDDAPEDVPEETDEARLEDLIDAIRALEGDRTGRAFVLVHRHLTSQGRELSPPLADTLVRDALGRSGWVVAGEVPDELGRVLECEPRPPHD